MGTPVIIYGSPRLQFLEHTTQRLRLGTKMVFPDGRRFVYVEMGATIGVSGQLYQSEAVTTTWANENATVAADRLALSVTVDVDANTPAKDIFKDGFLVDETNGHTYSIAGNTKADPTVLTLNDRLETDIATGDTLSMFKSPFKDVIVKVAAAATAPVVGVSVQIIAANSYGWLQTYGLCTVLAEGSLLVGDLAVASPVAAGGAVAPASTDLDMNVGNVLEVGTDGTQATIFLTMDS